MRICLCPASINWIRRHLKKSAKKEFTKLLKNIAPSVTKRRKGAAKGKRKSKGGGKSAQKARFKRAAKKCKGKKIKAFRLCMKRELKKR